MCVYAGEAMEDCSEEGVDSALGCGLASCVLLRLGLARWGTSGGIFGEREWVYDGGRSVGESVSGSRLLASISSSGESPCSF